MALIDNPLLSLHSALAAALHVDLPEIIYMDRDWKAYSKLRASVSKAELEKRASANQLPVVEKRRRPCDRDVEVQMFPQMWGSTALGYGGIGGAAMTRAYTVVVRLENVFCVYFGGSGRLAYSVVLDEHDDPKARAWLDDLRAHTLRSRAEAQHRYGAMPPQPVSLEDPKDD